MQNITLTTPSSSISTNKSLIKFYLGLESKVQAKPVENGAIYITTDTKKMYADLLGERITIEGRQGAAGKSAYQSAIDGGFKDTEANFNTQIASIGNVSNVLDSINNGGTIALSYELEYSTQPLEPGVSELAEGKLYLVYE